jgi:hypothetical protein
LIETASWKLRQQSPCGAGNVSFPSFPLAFYFVQQYFLDAYVATTSSQETEDQYDNQRREEIEPPPQNYLPISQQEERPAAPALRLSHIATKLPPSEYPSEKRTNEKKKKTLTKYGWGKSIISILTWSLIITNHPRYSIRVSADSPASSPRGRTETQIEQTEQGSFLRRYISK